MKAKHEIRSSKHNNKSVNDFIAQSCSGEVDKILI